MIKTFAELRRQECIENPNLKNADHCSMCGEFCALKTYK